MLFDQLNLIPQILKTLKAEGYSAPTDIQVKAIPPLLEGRDMIGCAQTGTGKTAAFAVPILQNLFIGKREQQGPRTIQALVLTPTRELGVQIGESFTAYGRNLGLKNYVIFGGVSQKPQTDALRSGIDILVATPGRLLDLMNQKYIDLRHVKYFVLDEADRMLDMGMIADVKKIISHLPQERQTMLFSATMPSEISKLVDSILTDPVRVVVTPISSTVDIIQQAVYFVGKKDKKNLLIHLLKDPGIASALVFSRTKHGADKIVRDLAKAGIGAQAIHGNKSQVGRQLALNNFKAKKTRVLVATDIAARGIDVEELSHVINYDLPNIPETYVHRIGRTGRAGAGGVALSFCDEEEKPYLKDIQKLIAKTVPVIEDHPYPLTVQEPERGREAERKNPAGQPPAGRASAGRAPAGRAPIGRGPAGRTPNGRAPAGRTAAARPSSGGAAGSRFPAGSTPAGNRPAEKPAAGMPQAGKPASSGYFRKNWRSNGKSNGQRPV